ALVLVNTFAHYLRDANYPWGTPREDLDQIVTEPAWLRSELLADAGDSPARFLTRCPQCKHGHALDVAAGYASAFYALSFNGMQGEWIRSQCGRELRTWKRVNSRRLTRSAQRVAPELPGRTAYADALGATTGAITYEAGRPSSCIDGSPGRARARPGDPRGG